MDLSDCHVKLPCEVFNRRFTNGQMYTHVQCPLMIRQKSNLTRLKSQVGYILEFLRSGYMVWYLRSESMIQAWCSF